MNAEGLEHVPTAELPRLSAKELRDEGYLLEVNRRFFHPLGLALAVDVEANVIEVLDDRGDLEGWHFVDLDNGDPADVAKIENVARLEEARRPARLEALGYFVQPYRPSS